MGNLKSTGRKRYDLPFADELTEGSMNEAMLPRIDFRAVEVPEIENWEVGKEYRLTILARMDGKKETKKYGTEADFVVLGVKAEDDELDQSQKKYKYLLG